MWKSKFEIKTRWLGWGRLGEKIYINMEKKERSAALISRL